MQTATVYGIKNCNTMKKCFEYLGEKAVAYAFFDYKKDTPSEAVLSAWLEAFGEKLINKQGLTYKKLDDEQKNTLNNALSTAIETKNASDIQALYLLIKDNLSMLKRPIITGEYQAKKVMLIGFDEALYAEAFGAV